MLVDMAEPTVPAAFDVIVREVTDLAANVDDASAERALDLIDRSDRVFVHGAGRSDSHCA